MPPGDCIHAVFPPLLVPLYLPGILSNLSPSPSYSPGHGTVASTLQLSYQPCTVHCLQQGLQEGNQEHSSSLSSSLLITKLQIVDSSNQCQEDKEGQSRAEAGGKDQKNTMLISKLFTNTSEHRRTRNHYFLLLD